MNAGLDIRKKTMKIKGAKMGAEKNTSIQSSSLSLVEGQERSHPAKEMIEKREINRAVPKYPFEVPDYRFDQKNEMFKRSAWDEPIIPLGQRMYRDAKYLDQPGFQQLDYAFRFAGWNLETSAGFGNVRSNSGLYSWDGVSSKYQHWLDLGGKVKKSPGEMSRIVKKAARFYGADLVGICGLHPNLVYSHEYDRETKDHHPIDVPEGCDNAIVMAVEMDYDAMRTSPTAVEAAATGMGYSRMVMAANLLAVFIRHLGYRAIPSGNDTALNVPLAMAAGLGEAGRQGLLITKKYGPRVRLCKVFTDLPLIHDRYEPFGVTEFCRVCKKCAIHCPSQAIPEGDMERRGHNISNHDGVLKWYPDYEKCYKFWAKVRTDCANCIRVCAFNKPHGAFHDITRLQIKHMSWLNRVTVWMDDLFGYGKQLKPSEFWARDTFFHI